MTIWLAADLGLLLALGGCAGLILRQQRLTDALVAVQMAGIISVLALMILAQAMQRPSFYDLALALALLSFPATLLFAHFVERWLK